MFEKVSCACCDCRALIRCHISSRRTAMKNCSQSLSKCSAGPYSMKLPTQCTSMSTHYCFQCPVQSSIDVCVGDPDSVSCVRLGSRKIFAVTPLTPRQRPTQHRGLTQITSTRRFAFLVGVNNSGRVELNPTGHVGIAAWQLVKQVA